MASNQWLARLGFVLALDQSEFVTNVTDAQRRWKDFSNEAKRDSSQIAKAIVELDSATKTYGKTLTKVEQIQEEMRTGKFAQAQEWEKKLLLQKAAAYDQVASSAKKAHEAAMLGSKGGLTAQQSAALGYQTTDIVTSLLGGQNPLMVLIQQGGQLRDQFGGFKPMFAGIAEALTPVRLAVGGTAAAVLGLAYAMYKGNEESKLFNNSLILTGNYAGMTAGKFDALAETVSSKYNYSILQTRDAIQALISSGKVSAQVMGPATESIAKLSRLSGEAADVIAKDLVPMLDGSAQSAKALNDKYHFLTLAQYQHIEALARSGQRQKAAVETIELLNKSLNSQQEKVGFIEQAWDKAANAVKGYIQTLKDLDKEETDEKILERLKNRMTYLAGSDLSYKGNLDAYEKVKEAYLQQRQKIADKEAAIEKDAAKKRKDEDQIALYDKIGGAQKFADLNKQMEDMAAEEDYQRKAFGLQKVEQMEFKAAEEKRKFAAEQVRLMEQEGYMTRAKRIDLIAEKTRAVDAQLAREKEDLYRESAKVFKDRFDTELNSVENERERLQVYKDNILASQQDLDIALSRLKTEQELKELSKRENMKDADRQAAAANIKFLEKQRESVIVQREELKRLQDMNQSVFNNMGNAIDNFVRTGKLSFKSLAQSIIQDLLSIALKAQMMQMFRGFAFFSSPYTPGSSSFVGPMPQGSVTASAVGGPLDAGQMSVVGENGPELFIPRNAGTIVPNNGDLSGIQTGPQIVYNGPYIQSMSAIDTQSATQFLAKNKTAVYAANMSASRGMPTSR